MGLRSFHRRALRSGLLLVLGPVAVSLAGLYPAARAQAIVHPAGVLDGPTNDILDVDGAAMAPDGTGGIVYRKEVGGVVHVFAVGLQDGRWGAPIEVDSEDAFGASQPTIAAGEGGRLLVAWVQPRNVSPLNVPEYELASASLQPGAGSFGRTIAVDLNVGEPRTGDIGAVDPKLAMAPDGAAYVVYRVILDDCGPGDEGNPEEAKCRPDSTDRVVSVRVARFNYLTWSSLGQVNRAPQIAMRSPTPENAPSIGIGLNGNGVVAWQEPDAGGTARIWVRRLFGVVQGNVLQASPELIGGRPVASDADGEAVAVGPYGQARIAFRIHGAAGSPVPVTQLFLNSIASEVAPRGSQLQGAIAVAGASESAIGVPSDAIEENEGFRVAWTQAGVARELAGSNRSVGSAVSIGSAAGIAPTAINPAGGGTTAWVTTLNGQPIVQVREDYAQGAYQTAQLAGDVSGPAEGLSLAGDGKGDALLAFTQGSPGRSEVLGGFVQAPPAPFVVNSPSGWVRGRVVVITWEASSDAVAGIAYTVYVDGRARLKNLTGSTARLNSAGLGDGIHSLQVLASDASGQRTMSAASDLRVDVNPPIVRARLFDRGHGVRIAVTDRASGVDARATTIAFGDGGEARHRTSVSHRYRRAGAYTITARVRDKVGNRATVRLRVVVR